MPPEPIHHELLKQSLDAISFQFFSIVIFKRFNFHEQEQNALFVRLQRHYTLINAGKYKQRNQGFW
jgi:hypothetical protein